jgi:two-component system, OmpR family, response regulator
MIRVVGTIPDAMTNNPGGMSLAAEGGAAAKATRTLRVLVADDDADTVATLLVLLRDEGYEVRGLSTGRHVIGAILDFAPDVVILDINLPDLSGWEVARRIRERPGSQPLLIGISGEYKKGSDKVLARISGFDHYLVKPYDLQMLFGAINERRAGPR